MDDKLDLETLAEEIKETENKLRNLREEYRERRHAGVKAALSARNEADKLLREELNALGYKDWPVSSDFFRGRAY